jgi:hypothetical protein
MDHDRPEPFANAHELAAHIPLPDDDRTAQRAVTLITIGFVVALIVTIFA